MRDPGEADMPLRKSKTTECTILAYEKGYRVLDDGTVLSHRGNIIKPWSDKRGYLRFSLDQRTKIYVHQLAAFQKYGEVALAKDIEVRHKNGNPKDNSPENILYGTRSENEMDKLPSVRKRVAKKAAMAQRKLTEEQVVEIRAKYNNGTKQKALVEEYGLAKSTIHYIVKGKTYR